MIGMRAHKRLEERLSDVVVFDGAMGTMLLAAGLPPGRAPESWNLERPEVITSIHQDYLDAGAGVVTTNTFGGNRIKLAHYGLAADVARINAAAVQCARAAAGDRALVAGSIGPTGLLLTPFGQLSFEEAYEVFREQSRALAEAGADLILIETMSDLSEARAAVIAAKENTRLPVACTMTFGSDGRTLGGTDPEAVAVTLDALGCDVVGANCSLGPEQLVSVVARMAAVSRKPVLVQPNAGLPESHGGETVYPLGPDQMGRAAVTLVEAGAALVGGCCGTTAAHIRAIADSVRGIRPGATARTGGTRPVYLAGRGRIAAIGRGLYPVVIGERINPTARKKLAAALETGDFGVLRDEALLQVEAGAGALDVNVGHPGIDEAAAMRAAVNAVQSAVPVPLSVDSARPEVVAAGLAAFHGRALLNSVNGKEAVLAELLPVARRYGAAILGLALDERGIPGRAQDRLQIARRIVETALAFGLERSDILIDCLVLSAGAEQSLVMETLTAVRMVREELGVGAALGVSNVSHGLPGRPALNATYLAMASGAGLDAAIVNPLDQRVWESLRAAAVLTNRDPHAKRWVPFAETLVASPAPGAAPATKASGEPPAQDGLLPGAGAGESLAAVREPVRDEWREKLREALIYGDKDGVLTGVKQGLTAGRRPLEMIDGVLIPGLTEVGRRYEAGRFYLPQLMLAAEAMNAAFGVLKPLLESESRSPLATVVLATVHGDIHDIGKNIVAVMLQNHGFNVIDLGRDVPAERIVEAARENRADLIGLSALMTTTMREMPTVIEALRQAGLTSRVLIGGAVVTPGYAKEIGADGYAKDAVSAVDEAKRLVADDGGSDK